MSLVCTHGDQHGHQRADTAPGALHFLKATPETVHWGYFSPAIKPALRIRAAIWFRPRRSPTTPAMRPT
jgi:hypothetical protein